MNTIRVDICYRPLRIAWAIRSDDMDAFRRAVRLSYTLWGGRFNPIVVVDREEEAGQLIDLFHVDLILPIGDSDVVKAFPKRFPHLINPLFPEELFIGGGNERQRAQVLDVHNALVYLRDTPEWRAMKEKGVRIYTWQADDPLADVFLVQFGMYPSANEIGIDYQGMLMQAAEATECTVDTALPISVDALDYLTIASLSRYGLERHYSVDVGWDSPGFFVGDATNVDDLVCHWNLRATNIPLWFVDPNYLQRYTSLIPAWEKRMREMVSYRRHEFDRHVAVWARCDPIDKTHEILDAAQKLFGDLQLMGYPVSIDSWNGRNVRPAMMHFGEVSALGVIGHESGKPKVSFPLNDKPFCGDARFHTQHLVASVSLMGRLYGDEQHTLHPPFIPELNEFYARTLHFHYARLRIESERIGLVIDATDTDSFLYALPVADLVERIFGMAGFSTRPSSAGLIVRQLIRQLGGLQGARVFKIPGVRRLLKTHGPTAAFTKRSALQLIASNDPANPGAKFSDHEYLYIEPRPHDAKLQPDAVFAYLVEMGLFRIGVELTCSTCRMSSWTALDALKQRVVCDMCGHEYDATRQLVNSQWHYRRSGLLGAEKNAQGAVPVALTLQQLETNLRGALYEGIYLPSLELEPKDGKNLPTCEIDFLWIIPRRYPQKTVVILSECKDEGPIKLKDFENDINNLRRVADALPRRRFKTFVLLTKLSPFSPEEIELAKTLNDKYRLRAILLTARELEPYHIYERTKSEFDIKGYGGTPEDLALATAQIYFKEQPAVPEIGSPQGGE